MTKRNDRLDHAGQQLRSAFLEVQADDDLEELLARAGTSLDQFGEMTPDANPVFGPQPDYTVDMGEPIITRHNRPAFTATAWEGGTDEERRDIDDRLAEQCAEMEADHRRWQDEWMR